MSDVKALDLKPSEAALLVIDIQEKLFNIMPEGVREKHLSHACTLLEAAKEFDMPVVVTEQYRKGIGPTLEKIREHYPDLNPVEKTEFSCWRNDLTRKAIEATGRKKLIVAGMETHICVYQTVRDLREAGYGVHLVEDAVISRKEVNYRAGLRLAAQAGAVVTTTETALFQLLEKAGTDSFKKLQKLIK